MDRLQKKINAGLRPLVQEYTKNGLFCPVFWGIPFKKREKSHLFASNDFFIKKKIYFTYWVIGQIYGNQSLYSRDRYHQRRRALDSSIRHFGVRHPRQGYQRIPPACRLFYPILPSQFHRSMHPYHKYTSNQDYQLP
jgi:hypothetical protein